MAKTIKQESSSKVTNKKNKSIKETNINEKIDFQNNENGNNEPILVNDKNEIIYAPEKEIEKLMESIEPNIPIDFIDNDVKEGIDFLKNEITIPNNLDTNIEENIELVEKQLEKLDQLKDNIMKNKKNENFNFTSYWNGITNKW